jgi:hypothetical protein
VGGDVSGTPRAGNGGEKGGDVRVGFKSGAPRLNVKPLNLVCDVTRPRLGSRRRARQSRRAHLFYFNARCCTGFINQQHQRRAIGRKRVLNAQRAHCAQHRMKERFVLTMYAGASVPEPRVATD